MKQFILVSLALILGLLSSAQTAMSADCDSKCEHPNKYSHLDLVLIIDKSGSMHGLEDDTIGGFNSMVDKQKEAKIPTDVTTVMFNNQQSTVHERKPITEVPKLTQEHYRTGGSTALLDSIGLTIDAVSCYPHVKDADHKVIVAIITDGKENASSEYSKANIKKLIEGKQKEGWEFVFLGANIDAVGEAGALGIAADHAVKYKNSAAGVRANYDAVAAFAAEAVSDEKPQENWREAVVEDR